uniref:RRM domain-containing protein n=1 Tax=Anopheles christyi TaxID=43041 RepID=A0A182K8X9_9DIPT
MSEDDRTLWCGNISEKVTEEMLYELFLQAGPVENVKIPRDADRRQRSYAFITFAHACSVEYAMDIFEGTALFQRTLTLHRKNRNGPNPAASPQMNFNYPAGGSSNISNPKRYADDSPVRTLNYPMDGNAFASPDSRLEVMPALYAAIANSQNIFPPDIMAQLGQQMLGAVLPPLGDDADQMQSSLRTKDQRSERSHYHDRHNKKPYSRDDRHGHNNDRTEQPSSKRTYMIDLSFERFGEIDDEQLADGGPERYARNHVQIPFGPHAHNFDAPVAFVAKPAAMELLLRKVDKILQIRIVPVGGDDFVSKRFLQHRINLVRKHERRNGDGHFTQEEDQQAERVELEQAGVFTQRPKATSQTHHEHDGSCDDHYQRKV